MEARKGTYPTGSVRNDRDNPRDTIKVRDNIKVGKESDPAKNNVSEQYALEKKHIFVGGQIQA